MGKAVVNKNMPVNPACFLVVQNTACLEALCESTDVSP